MSSQQSVYDIVMTLKTKKVKAAKSTTPAGAKLATCTHPLKTICYRWRIFKSKGPGYQTRMNRILRRVMMEGKKRMEEK